jgi:tetratricopeptide (TPR) repeat protein
LAYTSRGVAYAAEGEYDRAIADISRAIEIDPKGARLTAIAVIFITKRVTTTTRYLMRT